MDKVEVKVTWGWLGVCGGGGSLSAWGCHL